MPDTIKPIARDWEPDAEALSEQRNREAAQA